MSVTGVHPMGQRTAMLRRNLKGDKKNLGSTNKYSKFGLLIIRKIIKRSVSGTGNLHPVRDEMQPVFNYADVD